MSAFEETRAIADLVDRLVGRFPQVPRASVRDVVVSAHQRYEGMPIRDFVPVLVEHDALSELRSFAQQHRVDTNRNVSA